MATLDAPLDPVTVASLKGTLDYYLWRGIPVVRSWPRKPKMPRTAAVTASFTLFGQVAKAITQVPAEMQYMPDDWQLNTNWTWRDFWTASIYLGFWSPGLELPLPEIAPMPPFIPGQYYTTPTLDPSYTTTSTATGSIRLIPFYVPEATTFDQISWEVTATTGTNDRLAVYGPLTTSPGSAPLLADTGNVAIGSTGVKAATIALNLDPGWYLLAIQNGTTRTFRTLAIGNYAAPFGQASAGNVRKAHGLILTQAFGSFPDPLGNTVGFDNSTNFPLIWLRAA